MDFKRWLAINEDVTDKKAEFAQFFKGMFPDAEMTVKANNVKGVVGIGDRNLVVNWYPGVNGRMVGDEATENESYVKIDFFYFAAGDKGDFMGDVSRTGLSSGGVSFAKKLMLLLRGIKKLDLHLYFDAQGMDRADSYASMAQKSGFTLGTYKNYKQMWLAHPVDNVKPTEDPYAIASTGVRKRERRAAETEVDPQLSRLRFA